LPSDEEEAARGVRAGLWAGEFETPTPPCQQGAIHACVMAYRNALGLAGQPTYDRDGNELTSRGPYIDLPAWAYHVFELTAL